MCRVAASVLEAYAEALKGSRDRQAIRDIPGQVAALLDPYQSAGRTAAAIALFEQVLAARERMFGPTIQPP